MRRTAGLQLCDIVEKAKLWRQEKDRGCQGLETGGGLARWSTEDAWGSEMTLSASVMATTGHDTFVQTHRRCTSKSEPREDLVIVGTEFRFASRMVVMVAQQGEDAVCY